MPEAKPVTKAELKAELKALRTALKKELKDQLQELHDDLRDNHFQPVLDAIDHLIHVAPGDTSNIMEAIVALQAGLDRLGAVTAKLVVDGQTSQTKLEAALAEIERLILQGSADKTELDALKVTVGEAEAALDTHVTTLETLDGAVQDPLQPDLDPNAPVS